MKSVAASISDPSEREQTIAALCPFRPIVLLKPLKQNGKQLYPQHKLKIIYCMLPPNTERLKRRYFFQQLNEPNMINPSKILNYTRHLNYLCGPVTAGWMAETLNVQMN